MESILKEWAHWIGVAIVGLAGALYTQVIGKIHKNEKRIDELQVNAAAQSELNRARDSIGRIHEKIEDHEKEDNERFMKVMEQMNENHLEILAEIRNHRG